MWDLDFLSHLPTPSHSFIQVPSPTILHTRYLKAVPFALTQEISLWFRPSTVSQFNYWKKFSNSISVLQTVIPLYKSFIALTLLIFWVGWLFVVANSPVYCRMFSIPGLYPVDDNSTFQPTTWQSKMPLVITKSPGRQKSLQLRTTASKPSWQYGLMNYFSKMRIRFITLLLEVLQGFSTIPGKENLLV